MRRGTHHLLVALLVGTVAAGSIPREAEAASRPQDESGGTIVIASKNFTESTILGSMLALLVEEHTDLEVERKINLGGTMICWGALREGSIDCYPDYTGTGWSVILRRKERVVDPLRTYLVVQKEYRERYGIEWLEPFGLNNTYALAMRESQAEELGIETISDLVEKGGELTVGWSIEFSNRDDGWPGLREYYGLQFGDVRSMEHGLAYEAIREGQVDVIDAYFTDGKLKRFPLRVLEDDKDFFPPYQAAPIVRRETLEAHPGLEEVLDMLAYRLPDDVIRELNYRVEHGGLEPEVVAGRFLKEEGLIAGSTEVSKEETTRAERAFLELAWTRRGETLHQTVEHLSLTGRAVLLAAVVAIALGILITRWAPLRQAVLALAGIVQTIPSLALLAFMIPVFGLEVKSAIAALFLYAVLPILRNTYTGIVGVDPDLIEAARGMGLRGRQILWRIQLPLAAPTIMAGLRTSTVISIGIATLAAFIGVGGLGKPIVEGIYLNDKNLILLGAIPAALLAILVDQLLGLLEKVVTPAHMRGAAAQAAG